MSDRIGDASFKEKPDISQVFIRHLDRTNQYAGTPAYPTLVIQKLNNLPMYWQNFVKSQTDKYAKNKPTFIYKAPCGMRLGTKENPMLREPLQPVKRIVDEEGNDLGIDWNDPNIYSPRLEEKEYVDYVEMDSLIMMAAEFAGLTWQKDPLEVDAGDTIEYIEERKRTPFIPRPTEDEDEPE